MIYSRDGKLLGLQQVSVKVTRPALNEMSVGVSPGCEFTVPKQRCNADCFQTDSVQIISNHCWGRAANSSLSSSVILDKVR